MTDERMPRMTNPAPVAVDPAAVPVSDPAIVAPTDARRCPRQMPRPCRRQMRRSSRSWTAWPRSSSGAT